MSDRVPTSMIVLNERAGVDLVAGIPSPLVILLRDAGQGHGLTPEQT